MKFVTDGMLGKLTRWLRMMGHDVVYSTSTNDKDLVVMAKEENRILLTRDLELYKLAVGKGIEAFYGEGENEAERLANLSKRFNIDLKIDMSTSRCPKCNTAVRQIPKDKVEDRLKKNTLEHYNEFWMCPNCTQIYWQGAHWTRIKETFQEAEKILKRKKEKQRREV